MGAGSCINIEQPALNNNNNNVFEIHDIVFGKNVIFMAGYFCVSRTCLIIQF